MFDKSVTMFIKVLECRLFQNCRSFNIYNNRNGAILTVENADTFHVHFVMTNVCGNMPLFLFRSIVEN